MVSCVSTLLQLLVWSDEYLMKVVDSLQTVSVILCIIYGGPAYTIVLDQGQGYVMQVLKRLSNNEKASNANCPRQGHGKSLGIIHVLVIY